MADPSFPVSPEHFYHIHNDKGVLTGTTVLGRVKLFHVKEDVIDDSLLVDTAKLQPVSRLGGITYARTTTAYEVSNRGPQLTPFAGVTH